MNKKDLLMIMHIVNISKTMRIKQIGSLMIMPIMKILQIN
jgi:hypothetical protein